MDIGPGDWVQATKDLGGDHMGPRVNTVWCVEAVSPAGRCRCCGFGPGGLRLVGDDSLSEYSDDFSWCVRWFTKLGGPRAADTPPPAEFEDERRSTVPEEWFA